MGNTPSFETSCLLLTVGRVQAQDTVVSVGDTVYVSLVGGDNAFGVLIELATETVTVRTFEGIIVTIPRSRILSIADASNRKFRRLDPNSSRLLFGPTARAIGEGRGYFALYELLFSFVGVGVGPKINLAGGITLIPGVKEQVIYAAPKLTVVSSRSFDAAVGVLAMKLTSEDESWGLVYGVTTVGPSYSAVSAGLGYGFLNGEFGKNPVLMVGFESQASESIKFITENYVIVGETVLLSAGVRFFGDRFAGDLAFVTSPDAFGDGGLPLIPWLGFAYNFGK